jgi:SGNH hydrolase-like domain, acetyltransferase AlgX
MSALKRWLVFLRQTLVIAAITIVLCEIGLRAFHHVHPLPFFYSNSYNRFRVKPHASVYGFQLNSRGFMDVEFKTEKEAGIFRILGIGDSFAYGVVPYPHNYLTLLDERLNSAGRRFELINMGIPGANPREYVSILLHEGLELKPDMVLLSFFIGNDFTEGKKVDRIFRYSYLANVAKYLYDLNTKITHFDLSLTTTYDDEGSLYNDAAYIEHERLLSHIFLKDSRNFADHLANTMEHLGSIKKICDLHGIRLAVVLIPDEVQVDRALQRLVIAASALGDSALDFDLPNALLRDRLAKLGIDHLDLLQPFRDATERGRLYRRNDTHWNIAGNRLASELIFDHLRPQLQSIAGR